MSLRPPKQVRSRRTLDRLTEAAMELMATQGIENTTVAQIVDRGSSSVGSFYARFEGKDDFVEYLERRVWEDARKRWDAAVGRLDRSHLTTPELVAGVVRLLVETSEADLARRRVLGSASGSDVRAAGFHDHVLSDVSEALSTRRGEFAHPHPVRAVALGYRVIAGALNDLPVLGGLQGEGEREDLVAELTRLYLAYLGSSAEPPAPRLSAATGETSPAAREDTLPLEVSDDGAEDAQHAGAAPSDAEPDRSSTLPEDDPAEPVRVDFFDIWG